MPPYHLGTVWKVSMPTVEPCQSPRGALRALSAESSAQKTSVTSCSLFGSCEDAVVRPRRSSSGAAVFVAFEGMGNHQ